MTEQNSPSTPPVYRFWGTQKPRIMAAVTPKTSGSTATLRIYGPLDSWGGFWGTSAKEVAKALDDLDDSVETIQVRLNSPGGDAFEGVAIMNLLRAHGARTVAVVDGLAASAASIIAAGADELVMSPGTELMIHDASTFAYGDAAEMEKARKQLDSVSDTIAAVYAAKAGGSTEDWRALMVAESWYTADEAVSAGLADRTETVPDAGPTETAGGEPEPIPEADIEDLFDLSRFTYAGRSKAPAPAASAAHRPPAASAGGSTHTHEGSSAVAFTDEQITTMRQRLGVAEDADEATILAALDEALDEHAEPTSTNVPAGHVVVPEARLKDLETAAQTGVSAAKRLHEREREEFLDSVRNKYAPTNRAAWAAEYDRDPEGTRKHFENAAVIVPTDEVGHAEAGEASADDRLYVSAWGDEKKGA